MHIAKVNVPDDHRDIHSFSSSNVRVCVLQGHTVQSRHVMVYFPTSLPHLSNPLVHDPLIASRFAMCPLQFSYRAKEPRSEIRVMSKTVGKRHGSKFNLSFLISIQNYEFITYHMQSRHQLSGSPDCGFCSALNQ